MKLRSLRDLEIFTHVVDGGSFRAAARTLNLSPTVVSRRIACLEEALTTTLLVRSTRSMQITPRGEQFYRRCVLILNQTREAESELESNQALEGLLRVSVPTGFAVPRYLSGLRSLLDANPALEIELYLSDQPVDLRNARLDVVIRPGTMPDSSLLNRRLGTVQMTMAAAPAYLDVSGRPRTPADLLNHRCLRFRSDRQQDLWRLADASGVESDVRVGGNFFCDNSAALGQALYAGLGIGFCEAFELRDAVSRGVLEHVLPEYRTAAFGIYATYARERGDSRAVTALLSLISDLLTHGEDP
jgi:DNA-binding transcriptional LysR family regulator